MKKSELRQIIREVIEEITETDPMAQKFFLSSYNHIKKNGQKKTHHNMLPDPIGGGWASDTWKLGDASASDLNQHYSRAVSSPKVSVMMDRAGKMIWSKGSLDDLKELLVGISEQAVSNENVISELTNSDPVWARYLVEDIMNIVGGHFGGDTFAKSHNSVIVYVKESDINAIILGPIGPISFEDRLPSNIKYKLSVRMSADNSKKTFDNLTLEQVKKHIRFFVK